MKASNPHSVQVSAASVLRSDDRGVALVLTLGILAIVTLLVIAFVTSMRVENMASKNFNDLIKARQLAQAAVDQAVAQIRDATPLRTVGPVTYVTYPGVAYVVNGALPATRKPLYSEKAAGTPATDTFDLNQESSVNGFWITGDSGEFTVKANSKVNAGWIYVAEDGTLADKSTVYPIPQPAPPAAPNPIVGRFAYWVDDEASKVNVNTAGQAWSSSDTYGASEPLAVSLEQLLNQPAGGSFAFAPAVLSGGPTYSRAAYPYAAVNEVRRANAGIGTNVFSANQFSMSVYSDDKDDLDAFGQSRFILSTLRDRADIDGTGGGTSNAYVRLADPVLTTMYGGNFLTKYPGNGLKQIIANIIAYQIDPTTTPPPDSGDTPPTYLGLAKTPYINEVRLKYEVNEPTPPATTFTVTRTVLVELYYMYDDVNYMNTNEQERITISGLPNVLGFPTSVTITINPSIIFAPGEYRQIPALPVDTRDLTIPTRLPASQVRVEYSRLYSGFGLRRLDFARMNLSPSGVDTLTPASGAPTLYQGSEVNDPAFNENPGQWSSYKTVGTIEPPIRNTVYAPFESPPSKARIRAQPMKSVGELGFIHRPDAAWRYLTLQPGGGGGVIPDWAMLDIFTVGNGIVQNLTVGRININSFVNPEATPPSPTTRRLVPLKALLNSMGALPATTPQEIYDDDNPIRTDTYGMKSSGAGNIFDTIGEVCEIPSLATGTTEAGREAAIRRIANLLTVRSNTFTIWAIAQSIKEPNLLPIAGQTIGQFDPGVDIITGEVKVQAVVERYEQGGAVRFRTKYFRYHYQ